MKNFLLVLILITTSVFAADILNVAGKVMVVDFTNKRVELEVPAYRGIASDTRVCLQGSGQLKQALDLKCGKVLSVDNEKVWVEINKGGLSFKLGEMVSVLTENKSPLGERMVASYYDRVTGEIPSKSSVAGGMTFGLTYFFPSVHVELSLAPNWSVSAVGLYGESQSNNSKNRTFGTLLGVTYYTPQPTLGLHFDFLLGYYNSQITIGSLMVDDVDSIMGAALVGWKGYLSQELYYRLNAGAQYISNQQSPNSLDFSSVLPFFRAEVGVTF